MSITTVHHNLPKIVSKQIIKSIIGSLNATAIAYGRMHLRFNALESNAPAGEKAGYKRPVGEGEKCIDDFNEAYAAIAESNERNNASQGMGFAPQMQAGELVGHLMDIRNYFGEVLNQMRDSPNDNALSIAETLKFQMDRQPDHNDSLVEALALAVDIDPEILKAAKLKMVTDDAADLKANAGKILTYLESFGYIIQDQGEAEGVFNELPAHVQYKLMSAAIRAHDKASQKALVQLLRGKLDAAGDIKMLKGNREDLILWIKTFTKAHRVQLDEYVERGGMLPEVEDRTIVTA